LDYTFNENMAPRVVRSISHTLIPFVKSVTVTANFWDPHARSAFEFYRQIDTKKLRKINPKLECKFILVEDENNIASLKVDFLDGTKWECETKGKTAADLRFDLFTLAGEAEDNCEDLGIGDSDANASTAKKGEKKGKK
jgi:hypothetical protein